MARRGRKQRKKWLWRSLGLLALIAMGAALYLWWAMQSWRPEEWQYPYQGALVMQGDAPVNYRTLKATGGQFVYLEASDGSARGKARFARDLEAARAAGLQVGAVHRFDPCTSADPQSAAFVTMVPRDRRLLPPAIALDRLAEGCEERVTDAAVESELMILVNQVENHAGKPVILKLSESFQDRYGIASRLERNLWLTRTRLYPTYADRPWRMWTATDMLQNEASEEPLKWVVVRG